MEIASIYKKELLESIPVVSGMNVDIMDVDENSIWLKAPLKTNFNYEGTAFGGSLNTLGILSCYLLAHHLMRKEGVEFKSLVIQDSSIKYIRPVRSDFTAKSFVANGQDLAFLKMLRKKGLGRISLSSKIFDDHSKLPCVEFSGRFVATI